MTCTLFLDVRGGKETERSSAFEQNSHRILLEFLQNSVLYHIIALFVKNSLVSLVVVVYKFETGI